MSIVCDAAPRAVEGSLQRIPISRLCSHCLLLQADFNSKSLALSPLTAERGILCCGGGVWRVELDPSGELSVAKLYRPDSMFPLARCAVQLSSGVVAVLQEEHLFLLKFPAVDAPTISACKRTLLPPHIVRLCRGAVILTLAARIEAGLGAHSRHTPVLAAGAVRKTHGAVFTEYSLVAVVTRAVRREVLAGPRCALFDMECRRRSDYCRDRASAGLPHRHTRFGKQGGCADGSGRRSHRRQPAIRLRCHAHAVCLVQYVASN